MFSINTGLPADAVLATPQPASSCVAISVASIITPPPSPPLRHLHSLTVTSTPPYQATSPLPAAQGRSPALWRPDSARDARSGTVASPSTAKTRRPPHALNPATTNNSCSCRRREPMQEGQIQGGTESGEGGARFGTVVTSTPPPSLPPSSLRCRRYLPLAAATSSAPPPPPSLRRLPDTSPAGRGGPALVPPSSCPRLPRCPQPQR